jgi:hypothetical protein
LTFKTAQVTDDLLDVTLAVTAALDQCGIPYTVGGSLASSVSGEPRASLDADVVVQMRPDQIDDLVKLLGDEFYSDSASDSLGGQRRRPSSLQCGWPRQA